MVTWIYQRESQIKFFLGGFILLLDIMGIYFIMDLYAYDVAVKRLTNGAEHFEPLQLSLGILFFVILGNLLFVCTYLIKLYFKT